MPIIIARFSLMRAPVYVGALVLLCVVYCAMTLYHPSNVTLWNYLRMKSWSHPTFTIAGWIACSVVAVYCFAISRQLFFDQQKAIWKDGDKITYLNIYKNLFVRSVRCEDILSASIAHGPGAWGPYGIILQTKDGRRLLISTWLLIESNETILLRLKSILELASSNDAH